MIDNKAPTPGDLVEILARPFNGMVGRIERLRDDVRPVVRLGTALFVYDQEEVRVL